VQAQLGEVFALLVEVGPARGQPERPGLGEGVEFDRQHGPARQRTQREAGVARRRHDGLGQADRARLGRRGQRRLGRNPEFMAVRPDCGAQRQRAERGPARRILPVEVARQERRPEAGAPPRQHADHHGQHRPCLVAEELHRFRGTGLGDDAQVVGRDALAIISKQIHFGRQRQEGGDQEPVEPGRALEHGPHRHPGDELDAEHLPWPRQRLAHQHGDEGHGRQRQVGEQQVEVGGAQQGSHRQGRWGKGAYYPVFQPK
jgi:hypothetical protein